LNYPPTGARAREQAASIAKRAGRRKRFAHVSRVRLAWIRSKAVIASVAKGRGGDCGSPRPPGLRPYGIHTSPEPAGGQRVPPSPRSGEATVKFGVARCSAGLKAGASRHLPQQAGEGGAHPRLQMCECRMLRPGGPRDDDSATDPERSAAEFAQVEFAMLSWSCAASWNQDETWGRWLSRWEIGRPSSGIFCALWPHALPCPSRESSAVTKTSKAFPALCRCL